MDLITLILLAVVQGLTEFLPISSSAHLILMPYLFNWQDQGLAFDVALHLGTLCAVVWYFRVSLLALFKAWVSSIKTRSLVVEDARLAWAVLMGTIPVGLVGLLAQGYIETELRSPLVIAITTLVFAALLWFADVYGRGKRSEKSLNWRDVVFIGCLQAVALIPGTSRSGITITAALLLGLSRVAAARFSFLLAIPVIFLSAGKTIVDLSQTSVAVDWMALVLGAMLSAVMAFLCIHYFLKLIEGIGMMPFVIYRFVLGVVLLALYY